MSLLELQQIHKSFGGHDVLVDVSLKITAGEGVAIVGQSGAGKSTLLHIAAQLMAADAGRVLLDGNVADGQPKFHKDVQLILQDAGASLDPKWTVRRCLAEPGLVYGLPIPPSFDELLDELGLPKALLERRSVELSGGQRQRVAWARALLWQPRVLLLDEAFKGLDSPRIRSLCRRLSAQRRRSVAVLAVTHDLRQVWTWASRVVVVHEGRVVEDQPLEAFRAAPASEAGRHLSDAARRLSGPRSSC